MDGFDIADGIPIGKAERDAAFESGSAGEDAHIVTVHDIGEASLPIESSDPFPEGGLPFGLKSML